VDAWDIDDDARCVGRISRQSAVAVAVGPAKGPPGSRC
jgi:hypothetical protein